MRIELTQEEIIRVMRQHIDHTVGGKPAELTARFVRTRNDKNGMKLVFESVEPIELRDGAGRVVAFTSLPPKVSAS